MPALLECNVYHDCRIGNECILHSGAVIGADGFGFAPTSDGYDKIPQIGIVILEDKVDIGANTCVDRATMGATIIHSGVKIDNLVQIAHNDEVGSHTVMAAQVGIAGSTKIGEWCMFGGQVGIAGHSKIGDKVSLGAQSGVPGDIKSGSSLSELLLWTLNNISRHLLCRGACRICRKNCVTCAKKSKN